MCFGDRWSVAPPQARNIHEIRVFSKKRADAIAVTAVPRVGKGFGEFGWCGDRQNGIASPFHISKQPVVTRDSASKRCKRPLADSSVPMLAALVPISVRTQPG